MCNYLRDRHGKTRPRQDGSAATTGLGGSKPPAENSAPTESGPYEPVGTEPDSI